MSRDCSKSATCDAKHLRCRLLGGAESNKSTMEAFDVSSSALRQILVFIPHTVLSTDEDLARFWTSL